jgi:hypothetical protein
MPTLTDLTKTPQGDHTALTRVVTALLDDHMARMLSGDCTGACGSLHDALSILIEGTYGDLNLNRDLVSAPDEPTPLEGFSPGAILVIPVASLHVDPWVRITAWGLVFGARSLPGSDNYVRELTRTLTRVLQPIGAVESLGLYLRLHAAEYAQGLAPYGPIIDLLVQNAARIPRVRGSSPWWIASILSAARRRQCLGPVTRVMVPAYEGE